MTLLRNLVMNTLLLMLLGNLGVMRPVPRSPCPALGGQSDCRPLERRESATKGATPNDADEYDALPNTIQTTLPPIPDSQHQAHDMTDKKQVNGRVRREEFTAWVWETSWVPPAELQGEDAEFDALVTSEAYVRPLCSTLAQTADHACIVRYRTGNPVLFEMRLEKTFDPSAKFFIHVKGKHPMQTDTVRLELTRRTALDVVIPDVPPIIGEVVGDRITLPVPSQSMTDMLRRDVRVITKWEGEEETNVLCGWTHEKDHHDSIWGSSICGFKIEDNEQGSIVELDTKMYQSDHRYMLELLAITSQGIQSKNIIPWKIEQSPVINTHPSGTGNDAVQDQPIHPERVVPARDVTTVRPTTPNPNTTPTPTPLRVNQDDIATIRPTRRTQARDNKDVLTTGRPITPTPARENKNVFATIRLPTVRQPFGITSTTPTPTPDWDDDYDNYDDEEDHDDDYGHVTIEQLIPRGRQPRVVHPKRKPIRLSTGDLWDAANQNGWYKWVMYTTKRMTSGECLVCAESPDTIPTVVPE